MTASKIRQQWQSFVLANSQKAAPLELQRFSGDPVGFVEEFLGEKLTDDQKAIALSVRDNRETNVQASHGVGKSHLCSRLCLYFIYCENGMVITTAPTARQVNQIIWGEIRRIHRKLGLPGEIGQTFLRVSEDARGFGFTANSSNGFQGIHKDKLLVIEDEACGISDEIDEGASSCVTGELNRLLRVGNPIESGVPFEKACKRTHIRVPVWKHPNVVWAYKLDPEDGIHRLRDDVAQAIAPNGSVKPQSEWPSWCPKDKIPGAVSVSWIEEVRFRYGETSAYWQARVEGFFPEDASQSIIPRSYFLAARRRYDADPQRWDSEAVRHESRYGLDVGDGGDDHGLVRWRGPVLYFAKSYPTRGDQEDVTRAAGMLIQAMKENPGSAHIDRAGCGAGSQAVVQEQGYKSTGVHWGEKARDSAQFLNAKAEDYWSLREALQKGEVAIAPLGDHEEMLMEDLAGTYWEQTSVGKTKIEDKKNTKKRLHRSPNVGDAAVLGFRQPRVATWGESAASYG